MLKKVFESPIFNVILILGLGLVMLGEHYARYIPGWMAIDPLVLGIPILLMLAAIPFYNRKNPQDPIKATLIPMEFKEDDEGLQWITYKATRKVYIFFAVFTPVGIFLTAYYNAISYLPIILLTVMGVAQYLIYWIEIRKYR